MIDVEYDITTGMLSYTFIDQSFLGTIDVQLTVTPDGAEPVTKNCTITRISEISIAWEDQGGDGRYSVLYSMSEGNRIGIDLKPLGANVSYDIMLDYGYKTDVKGDIQSGETFRLEENVVYVCDKGYASIELERTSAGVFLVVRGTRNPSLDDISSGYTVTDM